MLRRTGLATALAAAMGGPYVATETEVGRRLTQGIGSTTSEQIRRASTGADDYAIHSHYATETLRNGDESKVYRYDEAMARKLGAIPADPASKPTLVGVPVSDLREVVRFDVTTEWVIARFARVSTISSDFSLEAFRVPIVTGTLASDLAGTLTYYFDHSGAVQRITVHGFTGNPSELVGTLTQHYGLNPEPTLEAGVYTRRWNGQPVHFLRLTHAPVVFADAIHQKYTVFLELNQPNLVFGISDEARQIVTVDKQTGRW